jgi:branched-chain amino acid transport system substrate-binding protein
MQGYLRSSGPRRYGRVLATVAAFALVLAACGGGGDEGDGGGGAAASTVKLGFFGALTGDNSPQLGINIRNGAKLAIDEFNAKGGATKVELVEYDSQGDPAQAPQLAQRAVTDKVAGIIGPAFSGESRVANPIFEEAKIPNVSASATAVTLAQEGWKYWHRIVANDDAQAPADATYMTKKLGAKKTAVIDDNSEYGKGLADGVRKALASQGATVDVNESIDPKATDYSSVVNAVKSASPDAIFYGGYYQDLAKLIKQLRDGGVDAPLVSGDGSLDQQLIDLGGPAAEGAVVTCPCVLAAAATDDPKATKFTTDYKAKFNADPGTYSTEGYDAAQVFLKAIEAGKTTGDAINAHIATLTLEGLSKPIKFQPSGEIEASDIFAYEMKGGKVTLLGPVSEVAK